jgi:hypothetical protein
MAFDDPFYRKPCPFESAVFLQSFKRIGRTGWIKSAAIPDEGTDGPTVEFHEKDKEFR